MAEIELGPLTERLSDEEIVELAAGLEALGAPQLPKAAEDSSLAIGDQIDDDLVQNFLDRLEPLDIACEIYLPIEFEGRIEVGSMRIGSAVVLLEALEELKEDLSIADDDDLDEEEEEEEEDEDEGDYDEDADLFTAKLRHVWHLFFEGAQASVDRRQSLLVG